MTDLLGNMDWMIIKNSKEQLIPYICEMIWMLYGK